MSKLSENRVRKNYTISAGTIPGLANFLTIGLNVFHFTWIQSLLLGGGVIVVVFVSIFLFTLIQSIIVYRQNLQDESTYGDAIILLKDAFAKVHHLRKSDEFDSKKFAEAMVVFCNNLREIFCKTTKSDCSVSIKVPSKGIVNNNAVFKNLFRDSEHFHRNTQQYLITKHTIMGNTPFVTIFNNLVNKRDDLFYINNDIRGSEHYQNTSKGCYPNGVLPYQSELVYPIIPVIWENDVAYNCYGYICIDSSEKGVFKGKEKYLVAIVQGVSDGIYDLFSMRRQGEKITKSPQKIHTSVDAGNLPSPTNDESSSMVSGQIINNSQKKLKFHVTRRKN
jgi:hypothetical protein